MRFVQKPFLSQKIKTLLMFRGSGPVNFDEIVTQRRLLIRVGFHERSVFIE